MASPRVVYGFMHKIITSPIDSPALPRTPAPQSTWVHHSGALLHLGTEPTE